MRKYFVLLFLLITTEGFSAYRKPYPISSINKLDLAEVNKQLISINFDLDMGYSYFDDKKLDKSSATFAYVFKAGDTMTGVLTILNPSGGAGLLIKKAGGTPNIELRDTAATPNKWWIGQDQTNTNDGVFYIYNATNGKTPLQINTGATITFNYPHISSASYAGAYSFAQSTVTTINVAGAWNKACSTTTATYLSFFEHSSNRLTYRGATARLFKVLACISVYVASTGNEITEFTFAVNGQIQDKSRIERKVGIQTDIGALAIEGLYLLNPGDYIEVWCKNQTDTEDMVIKYMNLNIIEAN